VTSLPQAASALTLGFLSFHFFLAVEDVAPTRRAPPFSFGPTIASDPCLIPFSPWTVDRPFTDTVFLSPSAFFLFHFHSIFRRPPCAMKFFFHWSSPWPPSSIRDVVFRISDRAPLFSDPCFPSGALPILFFQQASVCSSLSLDACDFPDFD